MGEPKTLILVFPVVEALLRRKGDEANLSGHQSWHRRSGISSSFDKVEEHVFSLGMLCENAFLHYVNYMSCCTGFGLENKYDVFGKASGTTQTYKESCFNSIICAGISKTITNQRMDAQAKKKALFRAKLNAQKKEKRIESPLVRYNEFDQPVCRVCDVVLKSESLWDAHQVSRKHREAISNLKANAAGLTQHNIAKPTDTGIPKAKPEQPSDSQSKLLEPEGSQQVSKPQSSSVLPPGFFDDSVAGKTRSEKESFHLEDSDLGRKGGNSAQSQVLNLEEEKGNFHGNNAAQSNVSQATMEIRQTSSKTTDSEIKQVKGILPEGFFDNKEADLRARGIKPVKPDVKDEYKEFEKLIQEDLQEVDDRLEEEEIDAAEMIEEAESVEQKILREKVEMLKKRRLDLKAANSAKRGKLSEVVTKESTGHEESSSDDEDGENFAVDWRAQHL
ncbi:hypothetical protein VNO77_33759 [Canavalia gladiata]|uniref:C2H2-type domain-containing protein n=1 Tax=Canavalia gladiata TaxID=3824 RepID=A0AAN9KD28_CANGL